MNFTSNTVEEFFLCLFLSLLLQDKIRHTENILYILNLVI